jgi:hypothetical protein
MYGSVSLSGVKRVVGAVVCVCVLGLGAVPALADQSTVSVQQAEPCPPNFILFFVAPGDEGFDRNQNGLICFNVIGEQGGNSVVPGVVVIDDRLEAVSRRL